MCPSAFTVSSPPGPEGGGVKPGPKPSLDRWGCACKISSRSVQGFGFPLALQVPTDKQTSVRPFLYREKKITCLKGAFMVFIFFTDPGWSLFISLE